MLPNDTVAELANLQAEYAAWLQSLPDNLQDTATAEALRAISELDLSELQAIVPPRGGLTNRQTKTARTGADARRA
jgi:hypothetical protein